MPVPGLVLHPRVTRGLQAVVMSDSFIKAASASVGIFGAQPLCLQRGSAIPIGTVVALEVQHVLATRIQ